MVHGISVIGSKRHRVDANSIFYGGSMLFRKYCALLAFFMLFVLCLSTVGAETTLPERLSGDILRGIRLVLIPASNPVQAQLVDSYTYELITEETTYTVSYYRRSADRFVHYGTYNTRAAANSANPPGDSNVSSSTRIVSRVTRTGTAIASSSPIAPAPGRLAPGAIAAAGSTGGAAATEGMARGGDTTALAPTNKAESSLTVTDGSNESQTAQAEEEGAREVAEVENKKTFAERYGDPVKLATGAMSLRESDLRVAMPGRAEDFSITRDYDSESNIVGFFGLGWSTGMESRVFLGRDEAHWPAPSLVSAELSGINTAIQALDSSWNADKAVMEGSIKSVKDNIKELELSRDSYSSRSTSSTNAAVRASFTLFSTNCTTQLTALRPRLAPLENHFRSIEARYNAEKQRLSNARTELQSRLAYSQEQIRINTPIETHNKVLLFPGQSAGMDKIGRENLMLIPLFAGNRRYGFNSEHSSDSHKVYRNELQPLDTLTLSATGALLSESGGFSVEYDAAGRVSKRSLNGTTLYSFIRGSNPGPNMIKLYGDRSISIEWNSDSRPKITKIKAGEDLIRSYTYQGNYLYRVIYPDGSFDQYKYQLAASGDGYKRLYKIEYFASAAETEPGYSRTYTYNTQGRVTGVVDTEGLSERFTYHLSGERITQASYTDSSGNRSLHNFDSQLQEIASSSQTEGDTQFTRDQMGRVIARRDRGASGQSVNSSFVYSDIGTLTMLVGPRGGRHQMTYDSKGRMTGSQDPDGNKISYSYDAKGNLTQIRYGDGSRKQYQYNDKNLCSRYIDEGGNTWQYEYNDYGYRNLIRDPLGYETTLDYDDYGRLLSISDPEGSRWQYEYDVRGRKSAETDPLGFRRESIVGEEDGVAPLFQSAAWPEELLANDFPGTINFNALELPDTVTWPDGGSWAYSYSPGGRLISAKDPAGGLTRYTYNRRGFLATMTLPDGTVESRSYDRRGLLISKQGTYSSRFEYDAVGRLSAVENEAGIRTAYIRDKAGRVKELIEGISSQNPYGLRHRRYYYDAAGNIIKIEEGRNRLSQFEYDLQSRLISETDPGGYTTRHSYADGSRETQDAMNRSRSYYFDNEQRLTSYKDPLGQSSGYEYSASQVSMTTPMNSKWVSIYDSQGRLIELDHPDGSIEKTTYNDRGQIKEQSIGSRRHRYEYDKRGNLTREVTEAGEEYLYEYDTRNNLIKETQPGGYVIEMTYIGNDLASSRDSLGNVLAYNYGNDGRLKTVTGAAGELLKAYGHDALGRLIFAATPEVTNTFQWDIHGRLISSHDSLSDMELFYDYDARGNLISLRDSTGFVHEMEYNKASEITGIHVLAGNKELQISRDERGKPLRIQGAGLLTQTLRYNEEGAQSINILASGQSSAESPSPAGSAADILFAELYMYDSNSRRQYHIDKEAQLTLYEYDAQNQLFARYSRYQQDSERTQHWPNPSQTSAQDLLELWRESELPGLFSSYQAMEREDFPYDQIDALEITLDQRGNVSSWLDENGRRQLQYDTFNRLENMSLENARIHYVYDALNRLVLERYEAGMEEPERRV